MCGHSLLLLDDELPEPRLVDIGVRADALQTRALQHDTVIKQHYSLDQQMGYLIRFG